MKKDTLPKWVTNNGLLLSTLVGVLSGVAIGFGLRPVRLGEFWLQLIAYPGEIFTRSLQMMILPLIISSLVVGSASLDAKLNGKIAMRTLTYFIGTSFLNAVMGVCLAQLIHPGDPSIKGNVTGSIELDSRQNTLLDNFLDLGRNIVPSNIFSALFQQTQTVYEPVIDDDGNTFYERSVVLRDGTNTLGIITFALLIGTVLGTLGERSKPLVDAFRIIDLVIMTVVKAIMWITPVGVLSLIGSKILSVPDVGVVITQLGLFVVTVTIGIFFYQLVILQLIYFLIKRRNPFKFYWGCFPASITGFTTASTAVALPVSFQCLDDLGVDPRVAHFVLPIGATVNKDGTALFVAVASIFIAQMDGIPLGFGELATVVITSTAVSIASASVPSAALALMFIVLNAIGAPTKDIGLLFAVDWLVDRIRTLNNVLGDLYCTVYVEHFSQKELDAMQIGGINNSYSAENKSVVSNGRDDNGLGIDNVSVETPLDY